MKLTGKCKEAFKIWILSGESNDSIGFMSYTAFINYTDSMQYGVLVDFFDSVGVDTEIVKTLIGKFYILINDDRLNDGKFETRPEARIEVITRVNKLYNDTKK